MLGRQAMDHLASQSVIIFGLGGVGSWCAEALVRTGLRRLTLVDSDLICATNVNRQSQATALNVGAVKTEAMRRRLLDINPHAKVAAVRAAFGAETAGHFDLERHDYVVDAIDSLQHKICLLEWCLRSGVKFFSSMGAAARLDPTQVRTGTLDHTRNCPLARAVRQGLRQRGVPLEAVRCVYSLELPVLPQETPSCGPGDCLCVPPLPAGAQALPDWCSLKAQINGALVQVTAVFGFVLASLIIRDAVAGICSTKPSQASY